MICFGDSNTFGFDPRGYLGARYGADVRWTGLVHRAGWEVANCGQNGLSIPREGQLPAVADMLRRAGSADVVTVMLGSNDLLCGASAGDCSARMEPLLRCVAESLPDAITLLISPPPMRPGDWVQSDGLIAESVRLAAAYCALALRLGTPFANSGDWACELAFDGVHLTPKGHAAFAAGLINVLQALAQRGDDRVAFSY